jgi:hypothetical protein
MSGHPTGTGRHNTGAITAGASRARTRERSESANSWRSSRGALHNKRHANRVRAANPITPVEIFNERELVFRHQHLQSHRSLRALAAHRSRACVYFARMARTTAALSAKPVNASSRLMSGPSNRMYRLPRRNHLSIPLAQRMSLSVTAIAGAGPLPAEPLGASRRTASMSLVRLPIEGAKCVHDVVKANGSFSSRQLS